MPPLLPAPHPPEFRTVKQLLNRMNASRDEERQTMISVEDVDLPEWQRQLVWTHDDMGLLVYSILNNYPIGMMILWRKEDGIRVPIDGRQRLTAIRQFAEGRVAIPALPHVPPEFHNKKYKLLEGDAAAGYTQLALPEREQFDDYELAIMQYDQVSERIAKDIFVKLQGGKSLTKAEVRAALGGRLCDLVTELTSTAALANEDEEDDEAVAAHPFFKEVNVRNTRKAHRGLCDVLLHEFLYPGLDKHWSSLETMYLDKATTLTDEEMDRFRRSLNQFYRAVQVDVNGVRRVLPQLRSTFLILSYYRLFSTLKREYALPEGFSFAQVVQDFERLRREYDQEPPYVNFNAALSNAGYSAGRSDQRHEILMSFVLRRNPDLMPLDGRRAFTEAERIAIWDRAEGRCEFVDTEGQRCTSTFANFRDADADHIVRWRDGGPTTIENGRLLCQQHNRGRGDTEGMGPAAS